MRQVFLRAEETILAFLKQNPLLSAMFFFLLICGAAAGAKSAAQGLDAAQSISGIPARLHMNGVPFLNCALISICINGLLLSMLILSGLSFMALILLPAAILLRGVITGAALGLAAQAFASRISLWLMFFLLVETAIMLPALLKTASISKVLLKDRLNGLLRPNKNTKTPQRIAPLYAPPCILIGFVIVLESVMAPLVIYFFC